MSKMLQFTRLRPDGSSAQKHIEYIARDWPFKRLGTGFCYSVTPVSFHYGEGAVNKCRGKARPLCKK